MAYNAGGPATAVWGWIMVMIFNVFVALSMAEIVSSYPISGGPYFWYALQLLEKHIAEYTFTYIYKNAQHHQ